MVYFFLMTIQRLLLDPQKNDTLELEWGGYMRQFRIRFNDQLVGEIEGGQKELEQGREFTLPDGSHLKIQMQHSTLLDELAIWHNGKLLKGSSAHPQQKISGAIRTAFFFGIGAIVGGALTWFFDFDWLLVFVTRYSALFGVLLVICAIQMSYQRKLFAWLAIVLVALHFALAFSQIGRFIPMLSSFSVLIHGVAIVRLFQGATAFGRTEIASPSNK